MYSNAVVRMHNYVSKYNYYVIPIMFEMNTFEVCCTAHGALDNIVELGLPGWKTYMVTNTTYIRLHYDVFSTRVGFF